MHVNTKHGLSVEYRTPGVTAASQYDVRLRRGDCYSSDCTVIGGVMGATWMMCVRAWIGACVCVCDLSQLIGSLSRLI